MVLDPKAAEGKMSFEIVRKNLKFAFGSDIYSEAIYLKINGRWKKILQLSDNATIVGDERNFNIYYRTTTLQNFNENGPDSIVIYLHHKEYDLIRKVRLEPDKGAVHFDVTYISKAEKKLRSVEDQWSFVFPRHDHVTDMQGPLDFVWSQKIKTMPQNFIPHYSFRTPVIIMQQGEFCAALVAGLEKVNAEYLNRCPLGMDLDVTGEKWPWFSYGMVTNVKLMPNEPCEAMHSQIVRGHDKEWQTVGVKTDDTLDFQYTLLVMTSEKNQGYRQVLRYVWNRYYDLKQSRDHGIIRENPRFLGVKSLSDWENQIFEIMLRKDYFEISQTNKTIGAVAGKRQGEWFSRTDYKHDAWFACWLQELVTGYGMYLYGIKSNNDMVDKAENILNFILSAPRNGGMFPIICYVESDGAKTWLRDDGWAGYYDEFHTLMMSWTGYLMLLWGKDIFLDRKKEIIEFLVPYADFLVKVQRESGCIPSWFNDQGEPERDQFRNFNAETSISATFLMEIGDELDNKHYLDAGIKALRFISEYVQPRNRWYDIETFRSCMKKDFEFYDGITAQYPQCNLSQIYAVMAYYKYDELVGTQYSRNKLEEMVDYLLLTQQIWSHPLLSVDSFGGFTVQNTDNEWSDVREAICAILLHLIYEKTGKWEYLCRGVYAMHSGFQVLPYENWAHCGYEGMQYDSSLLWGGGIVLTAAEHYSHYIGDVAIDYRRAEAVSPAGYNVSRIVCKDNKILLSVQDGDGAAVMPDTIRVYNYPKDDLDVIINHIPGGHYDSEQLEHKLIVRSLRSAQ